MKQITRLALLSCFLVSAFQAPVILGDAEGEMIENTKWTLPHSSELADYFYSDDFCTQKAQMDSYDHSPFCDSAGGVHLCGFLVYMCGQFLGFFRGFDPYMDAHLSYEFPFDQDLGVITDGVLTVDAYVGAEWDAHFSACIDYDSCMQETFGPIEHSGHYVFVLSPRDSCTSLSLTFSGCGTYLDYFSLYLTISNTGCDDARDCKSKRGFELTQNYPNPFNPTTNIEFWLSEPGHVRIAVLNITGENVRTLVERYLPAGPQLVGWDGKDEDGNQVASGIYFYQLKTDNYCQTKKMILLK